MYKIRDKWFDILDKVKNLHDSKTNIATQRNKSAHSEQFKSNILSLLRHNLYWPSTQVYYHSPPPLDPFNKNLLLLWPSIFLFCREYNNIEPEAITAWRELMLSKLQRVPHLKSMFLDRLIRVDMVSLYFLIC